ncbi:MAG: maltooligosyltrehalose trehalohydrolase, partial [Microbacteriaceae bacterium]|nr:maltooligosyltrehalose trehalohydrolase [Microbacteriaceae bacterium]
MSGITVCAPNAQKVTLLADGERHQMSATEDGWWATEATGRDYGFLIDDDETPLPDPRSRRQPESVH